MTIGLKHRRTRKTIAQKRITTVNYRWMKKMIEQNNSMKLTIQIQDKNESSPVYRWWEN
ncbi:MAG: hypothetical protein K0S32_1126 [Bacteroidetes bacterium]|jgi:hypothetical protein|nr:hypothetical protein [Bacteroidota bacterium]